MEDGKGDSYNFTGWIIGGRKNYYGGHKNDYCGRHGKRSKPKPSKKGEIDQFKQTTTQQLGAGHPPGAIRYHHQCPPPPPYHHEGYNGSHPQITGGGHGYYGGYSQITGGGHGYYGGYSQMAGGGHGYYGGYHGPDYPSQFPPPNQGGYNYGMNHNYSGAQHMNMRWLPPDHGGAAATGAPVYGHDQHHTVNKQLGHDHNHGGAPVRDKGLPISDAEAARAAANGVHHGQHDHSHGGHMAMIVTTSRSM